MDASIDILMATYNGEKFIKEQIDSLFSQSYQNFHLIIRDDSSTDQTPQILAELAQKYPEKIQLLTSQQSLGAKGNFACLTEAATAPYVMFSDQDDVWLPQKVEKTLNQMKRAEKMYGPHHPILIHSDLVVVDHHLHQISPSFFRYTALNVRKFDTLNRILTQNVVTGCTMLINQALLERSKPIPAQAIMHDWWFALVASAFGTIEVIREPTMLYRQHGKNTIGAQKFSYMEIILKKLRKWRSSQQNQLDSHDLARLEQAKEFYQKYRDQLNPKLTKILEGFLQLEKPCLKNRYLILKHRLYKSGFLRNFIRVAMTGRF